MSPLIQGIRRISQPLLKARQLCNISPGNLHSIYVVGGSSVDITAAQVKLLGTSNPGSVYHSLGGVARNIAEAISRLALHTDTCKVRLVSKVGNDANGRAIMQAGEKVGMDISKLAVSDISRTACFVAMLDETNDLVAGIADMDICEEVDGNLIHDADLLSHPTCLVLDANLSAETIAGLVKRCHKMSVPVFFEPVSVAKSVKIMPYLNAVHVMKPNLLELLSLYNESFADNVTPETEANDVVAQARFCATKLLGLMHSDGPAAIPVTLGKEGVVCAFRSDTGTVEIETFIPDPILPNAIVTTTGAGDTFASAFIWGFWVEKWAMPRVLEVACHAAALSLQSKEAIPQNVADILSEL